MEGIVEVRFGDVQLALEKGDITRQATDAIVNAANQSLRGGGGVDGAIHRAGGPKILEECIRIGGCRTGDAVITTGGNLKAKYVIHTVGPVYRDGHAGEAELLARCYRRSLEIASEKKLTSVAFPSVSTGAYGYPVKDAARIALSAVRGFAESENTTIEKIVFVLFDDTTLQAYQEALEAIQGSQRRS
jgi:O-acetyl-ADP-ribose deacetylase (regulator of RNase III)